jgi:hypothetical protein
LRPAGEGTVDSARDLADPAGDTVVLADALQVLPDRLVTGQRHGGDGAGQRVGPVYWDRIPLGMGRVRLDVDQLAVHRHGGATPGKAFYGVAERLVVEGATVAEGADRVVIPGAHIVGEERLPRGGARARRVQAPAGASCQHRVDVGQRHRLERERKS